MAEEKKPEAPKAPEKEEYMEKKFKGMPLVKKPEPIKPIK